MKSKKTLNQYRYKHGMINAIRCTEEEEDEYYKLLNNGEPLPDGVYYDEDEYAFYHVEGENDISQEERIELLKHMQIEKIDSMASSLEFFVRLTITFLLIALFSFIIGLIVLSNFS